MLPHALFFDPIQKRHFLILVKGQGPIQTIQGKIWSTQPTNPRTTCHPRNPRYLADSTETYLKLGILFQVDFESIHVRKILYLLDYLCYLYFSDFIF